MRIVLAVAALLFATPAVSQSAGSSATLSDSAKAPASRVIVDGATWRCDAGACVANGGANQPAMRACRRVAARLGPVSAFTHKGVALSAEELAACNA